MRLGRPPHDGQAELERGRHRMVDRQIEARGVRDPRVLAAMRTVPRERFVPPELVGFAFDDGPLPIGMGQTISQPYIVALMSAALELRGDETVLEIGTGSGYAAAILGQLARRVLTIERHETLATAAREKLRELGYENIEVHYGDGTLGWPEQAPFDGIVVAAAAPVVPDALRAQLAPGGYLVIPVGTSHGVQDLLCETRTDDDRFRCHSLGAVRFVPLVGEEGEK